jgi:hypothetical protein
MLRRIAFVSLFAAIAGAMSPAQAAGWLEKNFWLSGPRYNAELPACDHPSALGHITSAFARKEGHFWNSEMRIEEFLAVRQVAIRPWAVDTIPRRFCTGQVVTSDGKKRRVNYSIIEDAGAIGATWGVEWCVVGMDRNWAYNPACRMALP